MAAAQTERAEILAVQERVLTMVQHSMILATVAVADRIKLFELLRKHSDLKAGKLLTIEEIVKLGQYQSRYIEEILGSLVCAELVAYDATKNAFGLSPAQAKILADEDFAFFSGGWADMVTSVYSAVPGVAAAAQNQGEMTGVPFAHFSESGFGRGMERVNGPGIKAAYVRKWLPQALPQEVARLQAGIDVADLGTGTGAVAASLAKAFPVSRVTGIDLDSKSVQRAKELHTTLPNLDFHCQDMGTVQPASYDLIVNHDCIHDLAEPVSALKAVRRALRSGGVFFSMEPKVAGETLQECYDAAKKSPASSRAVAMAYALSTMHCMTVSCAEGGPGLGSATFGPKSYHQLAREAGFSSFEVVGSNAVNYFYKMTVDGENVTPTASRL